MVTCLLERTVGLTFTHWLCETAFIFLLAGIHVGEKGWNVSLVWKISFSENTDGNLVKLYFVTVWTLVNENRALKFYSATE